MSGPTSRPLRAAVAELQLPWRDRRGAPRNRVVDLATGGSGGWWRCSAGPWCRTRPTARRRARDRDRRRPSRSSRSCRPSRARGACACGRRLRRRSSRSSVEPVKEMTGNARDGRPSRCPRSRRRRAPAGSRSGGSPASSRISTSSVPVCGTSSAGLKITAFPQRSAGKIFQVGIASGKLNGVIMPADADRAAEAHRPLGAQLAGTVWPKRRRPSVAA